VVACPECRKELKLKQLAATFACPYCSTALRSNFPRLLWWVIPVAVLAEVALYFGIYKSTQDVTLIVVVFLSIGGLGVLLVYWALAALLSYAKLDDRANGPRAI
jgi:hypothetical protein